MGVRLITVSPVPLRACARAGALGPRPRRRVGACLVGEGFAGVQALPVVDRIVGIEVPPWRWMVEQATSPQGVD